MHIFVRNGFHMLVKKLNDIVQYHLTTISRYVLVQVSYEQNSHDIRRLHNTKRK